MKRCTKCGIEKPPSEFYRSGKYLVSECKPCRKERMKADYRKQSVARRLASWIRHKLNRDENLVKMKQRYQNRTEEEREKDRIRLREWHRTHRAEDSEHNRNYHKRYPEKARERSRKRRAILLGLNEHYTDEEFNRLVQASGGRCLACGKTGKLHADHVIPITKGGSNTIDNIQPLCKSCNSSKHTQAIDYRSKLQT